MRAPEPVRRVLAPAYNQWLSFRSGRERSAKNLARRNSRRSFDKIYRSSDLVEEYLAVDRLAFYEEIAELCASFEPRRVVDVGCGTGHVLAAISRRVPGLDAAVGVDHAGGAIDYLRRILPTARGVVASVYGLDLGETFDLVVCTEVLEHLDRPTEAVLTLRRLCERGGRVVVTVPDGETDDWPGHVNFWSDRELADLLAPLGETTVSRTTTGDLLAVARVS